MTPEELQALELDMLLNREITLESGYWLIEALRKADRVIAFNSLDATSKRIVDKTPYVEERVKVNMYEQESLARHEALMKAKATAELRTASFQERANAHDEKVQNKLDDNIKPQ